MSRFTLPKLLLTCIPFLLWMSCGSVENDSRQQADVPGDTAITDVALSDISNKITNTPGDPDLLYSRAKIYVDKKQFNEALSDIQSAINIDSSNADYYTTLADVYFATSQLYFAKDALEKAVQLDQNNIDARIRLAEIYLIVKDYTQSVTLLNEVLELDNTHITALFMKGMNYKEVGDTTKAIESFQKITELDPTNYAAQMQLGVIMQAQNNPAAVGFFTNAININPSSEEALYGRGLWYQNHDEFNKAIGDYTTITTLNPKNKNAHFNLGYLHQIQLHIYDQAIKHYTAAIAADVQYAEAYYNRGLCYEMLGDIQRAYDDYQAAAALRKDYQPAIEGMKRVAQ
jgi:tetratricopeptide (TPR) repeat protein